MTFAMNLGLFIQAGDRSLADVVAHEISHSWTGNLVTNRNFEHFWLNEGFTVFVERKILAKLYGEKARHFAAIGGLKDLKDAVSTMNFMSSTPVLIYSLQISESVIITRICSCELQVFSYQSKPPISSC